MKEINNLMLILLNSYAANAASNFIAIATD